MVIRLKFLDQITSMVHNFILLLGFVLRLPFGIQIWVFTVSVLGSELDLKVQLLSLE